MEGNIQKESTEGVEQIKNNTSDNLNEHDGSKNTVNNSNEHDTSKNTGDNLEVVKMEEDNNAQSEVTTVTESPKSHRSRSRSPIRTDEEYKKFMVIENVPNKIKHIHFRKAILAAFDFHPDISKDIYFNKHGETSYVVRLISAELCQRAIERMDGKEISGNIVRASVDRDCLYKKFIIWQRKDFQEKTNKPSHAFKPVPKQPHPPKSIVKPMEQKNPMQRFTGTGDTYGLSVNFLKNLDITVLKNRIFVSNLHLDITEVELRNIFSYAGDIINISILRKTDVAFAKIEYDHPVEAVQAISMLHNKELKGKYMVVRMDISKKVKPMGLLNGMGPGIGPGGRPLRYFRVLNDLNKMRDYYNNEISALKVTIDNLTSKLESQSQLLTALQKQKSCETAANSNSSQNASNNESSMQQNMIMQMFNMMQTQMAQMYAQANQMGQMNQLPGTMGQMFDQTQQMTAQTVQGQGNQMVNSAAQMMPTSAQTGGVAGQMDYSAAQMGYMGGHAHYTTGQVGVQSANQMNEPTGQINQMTGQMNPMAGQINQLVGGHMNPVTGQMTQATGHINTIAGQINPATGQINQIPGQISPVIGQINTITGQMNPVRGQMNLITGQINPATGQINPSTGQINPSTSQINPIIGQMNATTAQINQPIGYMNQSMGQMNQATSQINSPIPQNSTASVERNSSAADQRKQSSSMHESSDRRRSGKSGRSGKDSDSKSKTSDMLVFNNLPPSVTSSVLMSKMREVGSLKYAEVMGNGKAFVRFNSERIAARCLDLFHRSKVDGQVIDVKYVL